MQEHQSESLKDRPGPKSFALSSLWVFVTILQWERLVIVNGRGRSWLHLLTLTYLLYLGS